MTVELEGLAPMSRPLFLNAPLAGGMRVAGFSGVSDGDHRLQVSLHQPTGAVIASSVVFVRVDGNTAVTVVMTRDCHGILCPSGQACFGGTCIASGCVVGSASGEEECPAPRCTMDSDCDAPAACAQAECREGACLAVPIEGACGEGFCDPDIGCEELPMIPDAGANPPDSSLPPTGECSSGETRSCTTSCGTGTRTCIGNAWGACEGATTPSEEECNNGLDDDCDGSIDELCGPCTSGERRTCYNGPTGTEGVGACRAGEESCVATYWSGACSGSVQPRSETCDNAIDDDCNGFVDDGPDCISSCSVVGSSVVCSTGEQYFNVPPGVSSISIAAWGGGGGGSDGYGGGGGFAGGQLAVTGGEQLTIQVAEGGQDEGAGAGASLVYRGGTLLLVAAGGGGAAAMGSTGRPDVNGGAGGGNTGATGDLADRGSYGLATGGGGGTQSAGGAAGTLTGNTAGTTCVSDGQPGGYLRGGTAGGGRTKCDQGAEGGDGWRAGDDGPGNGHGGGGGSGYYGGGGGGGRYTYSGGGGGGGSSYAHPSLSSSQLIAGSGTTAGNSWHSDYASGVGIGGNRLTMSGNTGGNGRVVIRW